MIPMYLMPFFAKAVHDLPGPKAPCKRTLQLAKRELKRKGYTYRAAAPLLGVRYESLCRILNGQFQNQRVLREIPNMPTAQEEETK